MAFGGRGGGASAPGAVVSGGAASVLWIFRFRPAHPGRLCFLFHLHFPAPGLGFPRPAGGNLFEVKGESEVSPPPKPTRHPHFTSDESVSGWCLQAAQKAGWVCACSAHPGAGPVTTGDPLSQAWAGPAARDSIKILVGLFMLSLKKKKNPLALNPHT